MNEDNDYNQFKKDNYESIIKSEKIAPKSIVFPVLHNTSKNQVIDLTSDLLTDDVIKVNALAYSERDLGNNILDVISNIKKIRRIVDEVDDSILIHILGCGDPKTIALYIYCGVDSFDSRDWAKRSINHHNALTYPMNYLEGLECNCDICQVSNQTYNSRLLLHNLLYYQKYMNTIRARIKEEVFDDFITELISGSLLEKINKI